MAVNKSSQAETVYSADSQKKQSSSEIKINRFKSAMMPSQAEAPKPVEKPEVQEERQLIQESQRTNEVIPQAPKLKDPRKTGRPKMYTEPLDRIVVKTNKSTKDKAFAMAAQEHKSMAQYVAELIDNDFAMNYKG